MWVKDLRTRANTCEFGDDTDNMIRDKIVFGVTDSRIKERLLREPNLTLVKCLEIFHAAKSTRIQVMSSGDHSVQVIAIWKFEDTSSPGGRKGQRKSGGQSHQTSASKSHRLHQQAWGSTSDDCEFKCVSCGTTHKARQCPAFNKHCQKCCGWNHFAVCHLHGNTTSKQFHSVSAFNPDDDSDSDNLFFGTMWVIHVGSAKVVSDSDWLQILCVSGTDVTFKLDSGAQGNVLPVSTYHQMEHAAVLRPNKVLLSVFCQRNDC